MSSILGDVWAPLNRKEGNRRLQVHFSPTSILAVSTSHSREHIERIERRAGPILCPGLSLPHVLICGPKAHNRRNGKKEKEKLRYPDDSCVPRVPVEQAGDFKYAPEMTESARSLLDGILETQPAKRYTIAQVRSHPWFRQPAAKREEVRGAKSPKSRRAFANSGSYRSAGRNSWKGGGPGSGDSVGGSSFDGGASCQYARAPSEVGFPTGSEEECSELGTPWGGSPRGEVRRLEYNPSYAGETSGALVPLETVVPEGQAAEGTHGGADGSNVNERNLSSASYTGISFEGPALRVGSEQGSRSSSSPCSSRISTPRSSWINPGGSRLTRQSQLPLDQSSPDVEDSTFSCAQRNSSGIRRLRAPLSPLIVTTPPRLRQQPSQPGSERTIPDLNYPPLSPTMPTPSTPPPIRQLRPRQGTFNPGLDDWEKVQDEDRGNANTITGGGHKGRLIRKDLLARHRSSREMAKTRSRGPALDPDSPKFDRRAWAKRMVRGGAKMTIETDLIASAAAAAAAAGVAEPSSPSKPRGTQLLFTVEEPDRIALATRLREALESLGCACRILRECTATVRVRVKACRTLMTAEPREGNDEPIVGLTFTLAHPGTNHINDKAGCCGGSCKRGSKGKRGTKGKLRTACLEKVDVDSHDSDTATASVTTDNSMERCNSVLLGTRSGDGTEILVTLFTGAPYDFHSLVQELLASRAGSEIFASGKQGLGPRSASRRMRRVASATSKLRVGTTGRPQSSAASAQQ